LADIKELNFKMEVFSEIMTLEETAKYLKLGKSTLYKMARESKIPAVRKEAR
jgi:predicted DNA-binding transcriptional regulator AlpA